MRSTTKQHPTTNPVTVGHSYTLYVTCSNTITYSGTPNIFVPFSLYGPVPFIKVVTRLVEINYITYMALKRFKMLEVPL